MKHKIIKLSLLTLCTSALFSCGSGNSPNGAAQKRVNPDLELSEVSSNNCLNLEKVMARLQDPVFQYPTAIMTTNLRAVNEQSPAQLQYFSKTNFYYKTGVPADLNLMTVGHQQNCETVQIMTASREALVFKIVDHSATTLKLEFTAPFREDITTPRRDALTTRNQPYAYEITYLDKNNLKIVEKFKSFDVRCETNDIIRLEATKLLSWNRDAAQLPQSYEVSSEFLTTVKSTFELIPAVPEEPVAGSMSAITVENIRAVMKTKIRDDLKRCL
ncbi:MAG: hypothetical protein H7061_03985 [Bdellovibrionaceae bacterium]|nr:hypothetical protein [Bdellovibrio sp.]